MDRRTLVLGALMACLLPAIQGCGTSTAAPAPFLDSGAIVSTTFPVRSAANVKQNVQLSITLNDDVDAESVDTDTFILTESTEEGPIPVTGTTRAEGRTAIFKPERPLEPMAVYTATVTRGMRCEDGGRLSNDFSWTFTTGADLDATPPQVADTAFGVQVRDGVHEPVIVAFFSEVMDPSTVNTSTVHLADPSGIAVPLKVQYIGVSVLIYPSVALLPDNSYTTTVTTGVTDVAGNHMLRSRVWTVNTPNLSTLTGEPAPVVVATSPTHDASDALLGTEITATFGEPMDPTTLTNASLLVYAPGHVPVAGTVIVTGISATFVPAHLLAPDTTYVVDIEPTALDLEGVPLAAEYEWTFTTGEDVAGTPPVVQFSSPTSDETGVNLNKSVLVAFDEPMDPTTVNTATFTLTDGFGVPVDGMVTYTNMSAVFTPDAALFPGMTYTARITTGAADAGGEAMATDYVWQFSTGSMIADTSPRVLFTNPAADELQVPEYGLQVQIAFNEVMDPRTIDADNIVMTAPDGTVIPGTFNYLAYVVIFTPSVPLDQFTLYRVTVKSGVKDMEGAALAQDYSWWFVTTGAM